MQALPDDFVIADAKFGADEGLGMGGIETAERFLGEVTLHFPVALQAGRNVLREGRGGGEAQRDEHG